MQEASFGSEGSMMGKSPEKSGLHSTVKRDEEGEVKSRTVLGSNLDYQTSFNKEKLRNQDRRKSRSNT